MHGTKMKKPIEQHIFELLKYHDCVIITGLGGFILNEKSGYLNQITNQIHPPSKIISFNTKVIQNDGLLANYLASKENISYDQACLEILKFSRQTKLKIQKGQTIIFEGRKFKSYRGMGSIEAMQSGSSDRYFQDHKKDSSKLVPEGIVGRVPFKGKLSESIFQYIGGLRAGMGYCGAKNIKALKSAKFIKISAASMKESHPHHVTITREATNYSR